MGLEWRGSAFEHGFTEQDALSAMTYPLLFTEVFGEDRGQGRPAAWVGPAVGGRTIEVFAHRVPPRTVVVFHAMDARQTTLEWFEAHGMRMKE